ncbi:MULTISPECIES: Gfo/Idh/MocA family oxidoreductase [Oceanobacillus]|uniref:Gfo/Idh/MocA family oxidoreductase n=1 Tax=Oceanobacillus kimchii TaxID=746691 RepID=A0ABQ5TNP1_9BACI|nr:MULTISPECIES: Gfo/Idh/MocA family oxidoreductase [Oceanobacillus]MBT2600184.1 Gfo/Idh/MocA family oxidoreductase [Oceanobacillus sp. ISL-74]MBT2650342.1 Gfo/Idh/MocA family oxidoreductase [Oceanobacillus sp. ISL-73]MCT1578086.1 Gfo/Idh/MocA family oxidoreductase [Oceanobacillus kimchii]MCT2137646.1 Gfo/Idh/MocA family oxidoreductase [Oceanobacillus kimchii]GLO67228.1 Gfo/Idh/MocA family oxidoreductase [Oceanobacillus kimchii]
MTKLRMGIIGVGGIAESRHIPAYLHLNKIVEVTAVCDVNSVRAKEVANKFEIEHVYDDYHAMFSIVDAVTICTPNKFHAEIAIAALDAGLHVLCEKPMAMTTAEAELMLEASKRNGKKLSIAYHYRFVESVQLAKKTMNEVGDPLVTRVQAMRRRKVPGWGVFTNQQMQGGGSLIDWGCHLLDAALWLLDKRKPVEVIGQTYNRLSKTPNQINEWGAFDHDTFDVDDHVTAYIRFEDHSTMLFECSWAANIKEDMTQISISGVDGGLQVFPFESYKSKHGAFTTSSAYVQDDQHQAGILQAKNFIESCLGHADLVNKPEESLQVTQLIDAIYESSISGRSVRIP